MEPHLKEAGQMIALRVSHTGRAHSAVVLITLVGSDDFDTFHITGCDNAQEG